MTLQVFDAIEMIDIVVSEKGKGSKIDKVNEIGMIALACASLLLSALQFVHSVLITSPPVPFVMERRFDSAW